MEQAAPIRPTVLRPIALKVARPIPTRATEQFYEEAYQQGIPAKDVHAAVIESHDWHRKWTQQDEAGHTMPQEESKEREVGVIPAYYDYERNGARNPSPEAVDEDWVRMEAWEQRKRSRGEETTTPAGAVAPVPMVLLDRPSAPLPTFDEETSPVHQKRRFQDDVRHGQDEAPVLIRPQVVKPQVVRPMAFRPQLIVDTDQQAAIPKHVHSLSRFESPSPLSLSSMDSDHNIMTEPLQKEPVHVVEDVEEEQVESSNVSHLEARDAVLESLACTGGDVGTQNFKDALSNLLGYGIDVDTRQEGNSQLIEGQWLSLSKPAFFGSLGENDNGDPMYTLGRMAFDMFAPTHLVCSLQGNFNIIEVVDDEQRKKMLGVIPKSLQEEVESGKTVLQTYNIVAAFTIEPNLPGFPNAPNRDVRRPIRGIMTTFGYILPDPDVPNRHSIWFTGGKIEPSGSPTDVAEWKRLFTLHPPKRNMGEKAKLLAVKLLMGATVPTEMDDDGGMSYTFTRPLGGHGMAYMDTVYLDDTLRIVRGHRGTVFVFSRLPSN